MTEINEMNARCKIKGSKELDGVATTAHRCKAALTNNWDVILVNPILRHKSGDVVNTLPPCTIRPGETSPTFDIDFVTGFNAHHDYWYVEFEAVGGAKPGKWSCKDNFYCDLRSQDDGTLVQIMLSMGDEDMYVTESSGHCYVSLHNANAVAQAPAPQPAKAANKAPAPTQRIR